MDMIETILSQMPLPAIIADRDFRIIGLNAEAKNALKLKTITDSVSDIFDRESFKTLQKNVFRSDGKSPRPISLTLTSACAFRSADISWKKLSDKLLGGYLFVLSPNEKYVERISELERHATIDELTGCFNRRAFFSRFDEEMKKSERHGTDLSLILVDVDRFKLVNDTYGHLAGDRLLRQLVDTAQDRMRSTDIMGRIGGDEFAILMPHTDIAQAEEFSQRLLNSIKIANQTKKMVRMPLSISLGISSAKETNLREPLKLLEHCDRALYLAKRHGRGRSEIATRFVA